MSVVINTNSAATLASNNLASSNAMLQKSLARLSSVPTPPIQTSRTPNPSFKRRTALYRPQERYWIACPSSRRCLPTSPRTRSGCNTSLSALTRVHHASTSRTRAPSTLQRTRNSRGRATGNSFMKRSLLRGLLPAVRRTGAARGQ